MSTWDTAIAAADAAQRDKALASNDVDQENDGVRMANGLKNPNNCRLCNKLIDLGTPAWYNRNGQPGKKITCEACHDAKASANTEQVDDTEPKRRRTLKPRRKAPKLTTDLLLAKNGLTSVYRNFCTLKFKGRKHERSDLKLLLNKYQEWAHQLLPDMPFADFVAGLDKVGASAPVKYRINFLRDVQLGLANIEELDDAYNLADRFESNGLAHSDDEETVHVAETSDTQPEPVYITDDVAARIARNRELALERAAANCAAIGDTEAIQSSDVHIENDEIPDDDGFPDEYEMDGPTAADEAELEALGAFDYIDEDDVAPASAVAGKSARVQLDQATSAVPEEHEGVNFDGDAEAAAAAARTRALHEALEDY